MLDSRVWPLDSQRLIQHASSVSVSGQPRRPSSHRRTEKAASVMVRGGHLEFLTRPWQDNLHLLQAVRLVGLALSSHITRREHQNISMVNKSPVVPGGLVHVASYADASVTSARNLHIGVSSSVMLKFI